MTNIGDKLALQSIGNAYKIAQHNERQKFNELAAYVRVAYTNGMSQRHISEAVKLHRQTVARIIKGITLTLPKQTKYMSSDVMEGMTIGTYFSAEGFSLEHAKQTCSDMIKAMAKSRKVTLIGDLIFSPPHYEDQTVLIHTYSAALPTEHVPFCYMENCDCTIEERY